MKAACEAIAKGGTPQACEILTKQPQKQGNVLFRAGDAKFYAILVTSKEKTTVWLSITNRISSEPEAKLPE